MPEYPLCMVTGASNRLGRLFALTMARKGYGLLLHYHLDLQGANDTASEIRAMNVPVYLQQADLSQPAEIEKIFGLVDSLPHPLRVLVNSAAVMRRAEAADMSLTDWNSTMDLNLRAPFLCGQQAFLRMKEGGLIVNISDIAANKTWHRFPAYSTSKAALNALTAAMARSFAPAVRVNAIAPGLALRSDIVSDEQWNHLVDRVPMRHPVNLTELASALEFLLDNEYITGETITIDGGYSLI